MLAFPGHFGVGLIIAGLTGLSPLLMVVGSVIPDLDVLPYFFGVGYRKTHRTFTHSLFMPLIIFFFSPVIALGVLFHIIADLIVYPGTKLFYPLINKEYYLFRGSYKKYETLKEFLFNELRINRWLFFESCLFIIGLVLLI